MKYVAYSHCAGDKAVPATLHKEVTVAIASITAKPAKGAAKKFRAAFLDCLRRFGWSSEVAVAKGSDITITSMKNDIGLCFQTGNMARMYADLIKLQTLYLDNAISAAIIVVPSRPMARILGSNVAELQRLERELDIFKKAYHVPTVVFGLE